MPVQRTFTQPYPMQCHIYATPHAAYECLFMTDCNWLKKRTLVHTTHATKINACSSNYCQKRTASSQDQLSFNSKIKQVSRSCESQTSPSPSPPQHYHMQIQHVSGIGYTLFFSLFISSSGLSYANTTLVLGMGYTLSYIIIHKSNTGYTHLIRTEK